MCKRSQTWRKKKETMNSCCNIRTSSSLWMLFNDFKTSKRGVIIYYTMYPQVKVISFPAFCSAIIKNNRGIPDGGGNMSLSYYLSYSRGRITIINQLCNSVWYMLMSDEAPRFHHPIAQRYLLKEPFSAQMNIHDEFTPDPSVTVAWDYSCILMWLRFPF